MSQFSDQKQQASGLKDRAPRVEQVMLISVHMFKSITQGDNDTLYCMGQAIQHAQLVGRIEQISIQDTKAIISFNDDTGIIEMPVFKTNEQFPKFLNQDPNNLRSAYYCLLALIRSFKGNVTIVPQALTLIEDNNEICRHFMSMFLFHNHRNKKWPRQQAPQERVLEGKENTLGVRNEKSGKLIYDEILDYIRSLNEREVKLSTIYTAISKKAFNLTDIKNAINIMKYNGSLVEGSNSDQVQIGI